MYKIKIFFYNSYLSDKVAFYLELISFLCHITASMSLALTANNPNLAYVYPFSVLGSLCAFLSVRRRKLAWPLITTFYACCINVIGFSRAVGVF
jgi:hypothetical protein